MNKAETKKKEDQEKMVQEAVAESKKQVESLKSEIDILKQREVTLTKKADRAEGCLKNKDERLTRIETRFHQIKGSVLAVIGIVILVLFAVALFLYTIDLFNWLSEYAIFWSTVLLITLGVTIVLFVAWCLIVALWNIFDSRSAPSYLGPNITSRWWLFAMVSWVLCFGAGSFIFIALDPFIGIMIPLSYVVSLVMCFICSLDTSFI